MTPMRQAEDAIPNMKEAVPLSPTDRGIGPFYFSSLLTHLL